MRLLVSLSALILAAVPLLRVSDCPRGIYHEVTDDYYFLASSDQGAVGDVVAIEISVVIESSRAHLSGINIVGCYDSSKAELLKQPEYSEFFDELAPVSTFHVISGEKIGPGPVENPAERAFWMSMGINRSAAARHFPSAQPLPLFTVFLRLKGKPGDSASIKSCDHQAVGGNGSCLNSELDYFPRDGNPPGTKQLIALSTRHVGGEIRILPGEPTRPDPPALPPTAKVYDEPPTAQTAGIRFELTGSVARPGDRNVPLRLYITSNFEFSGFLVGLKFHPRYVQIARVEEHTRPGVVRLENEAGTLGLAMLNSRRRVGAEGERVHIATIYADVQESAGEVNEVQFTFEKILGFSNWIAIYHQNKVTLGKLPITAQVEPLTILGGIVQVRAELRAERGDANFDLRLDLSDPIAILSYLFLGGPTLACPPAADFNLSGEVDIADPIAILNTLFLGEPAPTGGDDAQVICR